MMPIQAYLVAAHLDDLRREAAAARLARQVSLRAGEPFGGGASQPPRRPDIRRSLARAAMRVSFLADDAARRLDPCLEEVLGVRRATRAAGR